MSDEKRKSISFDEDIVNEVYEKFEGKYTKEQIYSVLKGSIGYIRYISIFSPHLVIVIPFLGYMCANVRVMRLRLKNIEKKARPTKYELKEVEYLKIKIKKCEDLESSGYRTHTSTIFRSTGIYFRTMFKYGYDITRKLMESLFFNKKF